MRFITRSRAAVAAVALALAAAPGLALAHQGHHNAAAAATAPTRKVSIDFAAVAGSKPVTCGKPITGLGTASTTAQLTDLRFYVTDVKLLRKGGGSVPLTPLADSQWSYSKGDAAVTLIDLENGTGGCAAEGTKVMNAAVTGTVPKGSYTGISYSVAVPDSLSHTDLTTMPAPLNNTAMAWSWQFGRKFMKIEVSEDGGPAWAEKTFFVHIGSTGCEGNPAAGAGVKCSLPNQDEVTLAKFNPAKQKIDVDLKALLAGVDVTGGTGSAMPMMEMEGMGGTGGCMSDTSSPDCKPIFEALGMKLGTRKTMAQTTFRVVGK
ncbi:MAG: metallo-mystery pair system four-Cys motif protein [Solirubrobacterales bacterium 70-9]|nr:MAG: metallo-mystery pair system four-Cys motif protein [Solirubrobacterales bacterium 70-9]